MSRYSNIIAIVASLLMSSVAVGAAVGPAHAVSNPSETAVHA